MLSPLAATRWKRPSLSISKTLDCGTIFIVFAATISNANPIKAKKINPYIFVLTSKVFL